LHAFAVLLQNNDTNGYLFPCCWRKRVLVCWLLICFGTFVSLFSPYIRFGYYDIWGLLWSIAQYLEIFCFLQMCFESTKRHPQFTLYNPENPEDDAWESWNASVKEQNGVSCRTVSRTSSAFWSASTQIEWKIIQPVNTIKFKFIYCTLEL
jgi:hypothetical protein